MSFKVVISTFCSSVNFNGFWGWNLWRQPIGFIIFLISSLAECERLPFDLLEAEEELVAGYQTEYSVLYLGGWNISIPYIFVSETPLTVTGRVPVPLIPVAHPVG
ncbi:hypothetical protein QN277_019466 [Acacia crassicarpa]|uniref:NADH-plastoquinone oxidoreductase subunit 1 n=1 Tax=Acacia crassicarpa TaxID=499986 RepID=A0AAE1JLW5_9FABA|nr:hypothetical protein QN277_019466 [Acacia crassicarpa]